MPLRRPDPALADKASDKLNLGRVTSAKQKVAGHPNQNRRAKTYSSHFVAPNVLMMEARGKCVKWYGKGN